MGFDVNDFLRKATDYSAFSMLSKGCMRFDAKLRRIDESINYLKRLGAYAAKMNGKAIEARISIKEAEEVLKLDRNSTLKNSHYELMYRKSRPAMSGQKPESYKACGNYIHWLPIRAV